MDYFRPSKYNLIIPVVLMFLSFSPVQAVRQILFGFLGTPFASFLHLPPFSYAEAPWILTFWGSLITAIIWSVVAYVATSLLAWVLKK